MKIFRKIKREIVVGLSKICLKRTKSNYLGKDFEFPILYGMGRGALIPAELWMGECLEIFLSLKEGAVLDIGSNVGIYLIKLRVFDEVREYYGFEPNPACIFYCNELIRLNKFKNSYFFPFAVSDKSEIKTLYTEKRGDKSGTLHNNGRTNNNKNNFSFELLTFRGDVLQEMLKIEKISVIKIDVEGSELDVLRGLKNSITKSRPFVFFEMWHLPDNNDPKFHKMNEQREGIFDFFSEVDYVFVARNTDKSIEILDNVNRLSSNHDCNYMLSPSENVEELIKLLNPRSLVTE